MYKQHRKQFIECNDNSRTDRREIFKQASISEGEDSTTTVGLIVTLARITGRKRENQAVSGDVKTLLSSQSHAHIPGSWKNPIGSR